MNAYDVNVVIRIRVKARDARAAEIHVLKMLENHLEQILDNHRVVETGIPLTPENPVSVQVEEEL
jgi:hypothetical protein